VGRGVKLSGSGNLLEVKTIVKTRGKTFLPGTSGIAVHLRHLCPPLSTRCTKRSSESFLTSPALLLNVSRQSLFAIERGNVTHDTRMRGAVSNTVYQIDVLHRSADGQTSKVAEAKDHSQRGSKVGRAEIQERVGAQPLGDHLRLAEARCCQ